jgi:hypothetical protein
VAESRPDMAPAGWQVTATTIKCELVNDLVTIMVYGDWACRCVWWDKYMKEATGKRYERPSRSIRLGMSRCQGPGCPNVAGYRDKLIAEEKAA